MKKIEINIEFVDEEDMRLCLIEIAKAIEVGFTSGYLNDGSWRII